MDLGSVIVAGLVATIVMTLLMYMAKAMGMPMGMVYVWPDGALHDGNALRHRLRLALRRLRRMELRAGGDVRRRAAGDGTCVLLKAVSNVRPLQQTLIQQERWSSTSRED